MRAYKFLIGFLFTISFAPIIAPLLWAARETIPVLGSIGKFIYFVYSFTCHQFASRSFYLFDYQWAWCARDAGIWLGLLVAAIAALNPKVKSLAWYWLIPIAIPIAMDGGIQTIATLVGVSPNLVGAESKIAYLSNNLTRFATGSLLGIGIGLWMFPRLRLALQNKEIVGDFRQKLNAKALLAFIGVFIAIYAVIMVTWTITSVNNKPINALDSLPKLPANNIFVRRQHGPCTTDTGNLIAFDCFF